MVNIDKSLLKQLTVCSMQVNNLTDVEEEIKDLEENKQKYMKSKKSIKRSTRRNNFISFNHARDYNSCMIGANLFLFLSLNFNKYIDFRQIIKHKTSIKFNYNNKSNTFALFRQDQVAEQLSYLGKNPVLNCKNI